jgi:hypothetical protein
MPKSLKTVAAAETTTDSTTDTLQSNLNTLENPVATQQQIATALSWMTSCVIGNINDSVTRDTATVTALAQRISAYGNPSTLDTTSMQNLEIAIILLGEVIFSNTNLAAQGEATGLSQTALDAAANAVAPFTNAAYASFSSLISAYTCLFYILNAEPAGQAPPAACSGAVSTLSSFIENTTSQSQIAWALSSMSNNMNYFAAGDARVVNALVQVISAYGNPGELGTLDQMSIQNLQTAIELVGNVISTNAGLTQGTSGATILPQSAFDTAASAVAPFIKNANAFFPSIFQTALNCFTAILYAEPTGQAPSTEVCSAVLSPLSDAVNANNAGTVVLLLAKMTAGGTTFIDKWKEMYDTLSAGDPQKEILGACITACCFTNPSLAGIPAYKEMLGLDSATIAAMVAQSPSWSFGTAAADPPRTVFGYYQKIYDITQAYPGVPVVKTLFNQDNITLFTNYPDTVIKHLYYDSATTSEKPIVLMVFTKRPNGFPFGGIFSAFDYDNFDIRVIEPGSPVNMASLMESTSARLGGKKFNWFIVNGHGAPTQVNLAKTVVDVEPALGPQPNDLNVNDGPILERIKPLLITGPSIILDACSTAGSNGCYPDLAVVMAEDLQGICFGAETPATGVQSIGYKENSSASGGKNLGIEEYTVTSVAFGNAETGVYDYRVPSVQGPITSPLISAPAVRHAGNTYTISAANGTECSVYDLRGRQIAKLVPDASGEFVWNSSKAAAGTYVARISLVEEGKTIDAKSVGFSKTR